MYWQRVSSLSSCLIVFGRYPIPGKVKTRLIPYLGPVGSAQLQRELTEDVVKKARAVSYMADLIFFFEGGSKALLKRWLGKDIVYLPQRGIDLGDKMGRAILAAQEKGYKKMVLIGTDIPQLDPLYIREAFYKLDQYDIVLGPSDDGGYWLIGMKKFFDVFSRIEWGTDKVLSQTIGQIKRWGLSFCLLKELTDIDNPEDIDRTGIKVALPYISVIIPTLNEEGNIRAVIDRARSADAEIIVVDGGSQDKTKKIAREEGVKVVESKRGRSFQQNKGAELAKGKILLFLHADTRLPKDYPFYVFNIFMDPECIVGAFRFKTDMEHPFMKIIEFVANIRARYLGLPYGDQALFMEKSIFEAIGGFPEVPIAEDLYLMQRVSKMGKVGIVPECAITSSRKWKNYGIIKTTYLHWRVLIELYYERFKKGGIL